ncbi:hypothetical protein V6N13_143991 [Hibiscus sabdariffa]
MPLRCRRRSMQKGKPAVGSSNKPLETHEGTKTVEADDLCNFSRNSGLCICIVTWNMNGHAFASNTRDDSSNV